MGPTAESGETNDPDWGTEPGDLPPEPPVKRGPGRPRKTATQTVITRRVLDEEREPADENFAALFDEGFISKGAVRVRITRADPHEGLLGYIEDQEATEKEILERWGGSTYRLDGLNTKGQILQTRTIRISGDPIFVGEAFEAQWRKSRGLPPKGAGTVPTLGPADVLRMMDEREERRRVEEKDREESRRRSDEAAEDKRRERDREWQAQRERDQREHDARMKRDDEDRDRRRRAEEQERDDRRRADNERATQQSQEFMKSMLGIISSSNQQSLQLLTASHKSEGGFGETLKMILAVKEAFGGGGDNEDEASPLNLLIKHAPDILNGISSAAQAAIHEVKNAPGTLPPQQRPPVQQRLPAQQQATPAGGFTLPSDSPLAPKLATLAAKIAAKGQNPEVVLAGVADQLIATLDSNVPQAAQAGAINTPAARPTPGRVSFKR